MTQAHFVIPGDLDLPTGGYAYDRRLLALLGDEGIDIRHVQLPGSYPSPSDADLAETRRIIAGLPQQAVLLIDGLAYGAMPRAVIADFGRPIVALCHHPLGLEAGLSPTRQAELVATERIALAMAREVIVTSPATRLILTRDFDVASGRITVAIPGTDPAPKARGTRTPTRLLAVGSVVPRKSYDILVRALATLRDDDWHLDIAGADDRSPETTMALHRLIAEERLASRITLHGTVSDHALAALYDGADAFVLSSLFEGYGMVLAEAMARGLPIVSTTGGAAAETVPDDAAIKVAPGDAEALAVALARMLGDAGARAAMAEASWRAGQRLPRWGDTARIVAGALRKAMT